MSDLKITGAIHKVFETQEVSSTFKKREFVIVTQGEYPEHVKFELTQAKCDEISKHKVGDEITVHFNIRGRKWDSPQGETKYFVSLNAWRIEKATAAASNEAVAKDNDWPSDDDTPF